MSPINYHIKAIQEYFKNTYGAKVHIGLDVIEAEPSLALSMAEELGEPMHIPNSGNIAVIKEGSSMFVFVKELNENG